MIGVVKVLIHSIITLLQLFELLALSSTCYCQINYVTDSSAITAIREQDTLYKVKYNETIELPCIIENRKNANVIWQYSKSRIPETLSIGYFYYRKDYRIRVIANVTNEKEQPWNLEIRKVRFEDEGYYLCKVMAEPESLKRAVYLKVEVDLKLVPDNPIVALGENFDLICNTSYQVISSTTNETHGHSNSRSKVSRNNHHHQHHQQGQQSHPRLVWYKDGQRLLNSNNNLFGANLNGSVQQLDFKIEYSIKPVLWSRLHLRALKPQDLGVYTCMFRNQSVSTVISLDNCELF
jgi:hypothetical protein